MINQLTLALLVSLCGAVSLRSGLEESEIKDEFSLTKDISDIIDYLDSIGASIMK